MEGCRSSVHTDGFFEYFFPFSLNTYVQPDENSVEKFYQTSAVAQLRVFAVCFPEGFHRHFLKSRNSTSRNSTMESAATLFGKTVFQQSG